MLRQGRSSREHSAADQRIFCLADVWGSEEAVLVYQDSKGYTFRETVSLFRFQEHWDCTQSIFQSGAKPFVLSLTVTDQLSQKLERIVKKAQSPMQIRVDGQYPKSLRVSADGKRYGVVTVQTLADLAHYFIEKSRGKNTDYLRVNQVNLELQETAPEALSLLHARSLLMRRFSRQLLGMGFGH
jgi:hypothetical protein